MFSNEAAPGQFAEGARKTGEILADMKDVLLAAHVNLDGDALGSLAACGFLLKKLGKRFAIYSSTGVPDYLRFLELPGQVHKDLAFLPFTPQYAIYLDCSEASRLGRELAEKCDCWPSVNIDHHITEKGLGSLYNFISTEAAATSQLVAYVAEELGQKLSGRLARSLALGLMTDTGGFCHGNTTADVFELCARLARNGCNMANLRENLQNSWSLDKLRLWGRAFELTQLHDKGRIAICSISSELLESCHCSREDLEGLVEWLRKIRGVQVAALVREENRGKCKFSLRSIPEIDVREMAAELGGGGHRNAAGGSINGTVAEASRQLLQVACSQLAQPERAR